MFRFFYLIVMINFLLFACKHKQIDREQINLDKDWKFLYNDSTYPASVPGCIHTDLLDNHLIPDPFFRSNEDSLQWIGDRTWVYSKSFSVDDDVFDKQHITLFFHGLDTYAKVYLNGHLLLMADNMFRTWSADVKGRLTKDKNKLKLVFEPSPEINRKKAREDQEALPDRRAYTRKAPYQFGWDWGPRFVTCGIWKSVELVAWNNAMINDLQIYNERLSDSLAKITARIGVRSHKQQTAELNLKVKGKPEKTIGKKVMLTKGENIIRISFDLEDPVFWWPVGLGDPYLYDLELTLKTADKTRDIQPVRFGIRDITLVTGPDSIGSPFYLKINGKPLFIKGANYIPQDNFLNRPGEFQYKKLINSVLDANMNMLRVWGGGIYEADLFYNLCDEAGLLLWQDFMFACTMYPGDQAFFENVEQEAIDQVKRLRNHPSIAIWCGNNEIDEGWHNWGWQEQYNYGVMDSIRIWDDYIRLFHEILPGVIDQYDPHRFYWPSSPLIGWGHEESLRKGDMHYWGVWWGAEPFDMYGEKVGRFMSEYGFQGFPALATIDSFTQSTDQRLGSSVLKTHQKHPRGFELIDLYMARDYPVPADFRDYVYMSQLVQAYGITKAIEAHRRAKPYCMGTLYWQLNDCWPAISWSSIDYYGNWKALHYFAKEAYQDVLVSIPEVKDTLAVYVVSDLQTRLSGVLILTLMDFHGNTTWRDSAHVSVQPNSVSLAYHYPGFIDIVQDVHNHVLFVSFALDDGQELATKVYYFTMPKNLHLPSEELRLDYEKTKLGYQFELYSDRLIKNICLMLPGLSGHFSDNYFDLMPGEVKKVDFNTHEQIKYPREQLQITTLNQIVREGASQMQSRREKGIN